MKKDEKSYERVSVSLPKEVAMNLKILAIENNTSASGMISEWVKTASKNSAMLIKLNA